MSNTKFDWRYRPDLNWRMKVLQTFALPLGHGTTYEKRNAHCIPILFGAGDEARTRYLHLGKVALYRMSYTRILPTVGIESLRFRNSRVWCLRSESNQRHADFQSAALPTELQRHLEQTCCSKHADAYLNGDPERTRTVDLQRDRLAC